MLATFRRIKQQRGFTLLEILVVLAIVAALVAITVPQMSRMAERVRISSEKKTLLASIEGLSYRAFSSGTALRFDTSEKLFAWAAKEKLGVPAGWTMTLLAPVSIAANGICSGGTIQITLPDQTQELWKLQPPLCRIKVVAEI